MSKSVLPQLWKWGCKNQNYHRDINQMKKSSKLFPQGHVQYSNLNFLPQPWEWGCMNQNYHMEINQLKKSSKLFPHEHIQCSNLFSPNYQIIYIMVLFNYFNIKRINITIFKMIIVKIKFILKITILNYHILLY